MTPPLAFAVVANRAYAMGAEATILSIRRFYAPVEADIIAFLADPPPELVRVCRAAGVEVHGFHGIDSWAVPLAYGDAKRTSDARHFYHPRFTPHPDLPCAFVWPHARAMDRIHHINPMRMKGYATAFCTNVRGYERVIHIDSDAFLLARVDELFARHPEPDTVIGCDDVSVELENADLLLGFERPRPYDAREVSFNAGIVWYRNGPAVRRLMEDFVFYLDSPYHYDVLRNDQVLLRALVLKHRIQHGLGYALEDGTHFNPTCRRAIDLRFDEARGIWLNVYTGEQQRVYHATVTGLPKPWSGTFASPSIEQAWRWVGGRVEGEAAA